LVYRSVDGPKNWPKLVLIPINCVVHDVTPVLAFIHDLYLFPNVFYRGAKSKKLRWTRNMACMRDNRNTYGVLVGKPEEKVLFRKPSFKSHGIITWALKAKYGREWAGFVV